MGYSKVVIGGETKIDLTADTVTADKLASGITAHGKDGELVTGTNTFDADTSDANATAAEVLLDKTAYVNGNKVTGTMPNNGAVAGKITDADTPFTIARGYHDGSGTVAIDDTEKAKLIAENIKEGVEVLGITGTLAPASGVTAQAKTVTPTMNDQAILPDTGYDYLSQVTVNKIPVTETPNAAGGTTITVG